MAEQIFDENGVSDFVDANGQTGFVDQDGDFFAGDESGSRRRYVAFNMCWALLALLPLFSRRLML